MTNQTSGQTRRTFLATSAPTGMALALADPNVAEADAGLPTPSGPGPASGAPNQPAGFEDSFASRYVDADGLRMHAVMEARKLSSRLSYRVAMAR